MYQSFIFLYFFGVNPVCVRKCLQNSDEETKFNSSAILYIVLSEFLSSLLA